MSKGKRRIRFHVSNYGSDHKRIERTDEEAEGTVIRSEGDGLLVHVDGHELPFYVEPDDIIDPDD